MSLNDSVSPSDNVVGASLFVSSIASVLVLTTFLTSSLVSTWFSLPAAPKRDPKKDSKDKITQDRRRQNLIPVLAAAATSSFAVLSYHLRNVLVQSYTSWALTTKFTSRTFLSDLHLWEWMKESTLLHDFAFELVNERQSYIWTQLGLLATMAVNIYMSYEAPLHGVPHLWAYYVLTQILPVSFTQHLFLIALLLCQVQSNASTKKQADSKKEAKDAPQGGTLEPAPKDFVNMGLAALLMVFLSSVPNLKDNEKFFVPMLLGLRLVLFAPYLTTYMDYNPQPAKSETSEGGDAAKDAPKDAPEPKYYSYFLLVTAANLLSAMQIMVIVQNSSLGSILSALNGHPAVGAIGYDFLLSIGAWVIWIIGLNA